MRNLIAKSSERRMPKSTRRRIVDLTQKWPHRSDFGGGKRENVKSLPQMSYHCCLFTAAVVSDVCALFCRVYTYIEYLFLQTCLALLRTGDMSSDSLDALLDEALDVMEKNDEDIRQERELMADRLLDEKRMKEDMERQQQSSSAAASGDEANLLQAVTSLLEVLKQGPEAMESAPQEEVDRIQKMLQQTLGGMRDGATAEELHSIDRCQELLTKAHAAGDEETSPEQVEEMLRALQEATGGNGAPGAAGEVPFAAADGPAPEALQGDLARLMEMIAKESQQQATASNTSGTHGGSSSSADQSTTDTEALKLFFQMLKPDALTESFRAMSDVFPAWLESNGASLDAAELARYRSQHAKMEAVLVVVSEGALDAALKPDATDEEKRRFDRFTSLLDELQVLGLPPPSLVEMIQQRHEQQSSN